jgi:hypothetical protein
VPAGFFRTAASSAALPGTAGLSAAGRALTTGLVGATGARYTGAASRKSSGFVSAPAGHLAAAGVLASGSPRLPAGVVSTG